MKLMLQIAVGVFIGLAALLLVRAIPGWVEESRESAATHVIHNLTTDDIIARCGKPLTDETKDAETIQFRTLSYEDRYGAKLFINLMGLAEPTAKFQIISMDDSTESLKGASDRERLDRLPCLSVAK